MLGGQNWLHVKQMGKQMIKAVMKHLKLLKQSELLTVNNKGSEVASTFAWLSLSLKLDNMTQKNSFSLLPSYWLLPLDDLYAFILTKAPINDVRTVSKSISLRQLSSEIQKFSLLLVQGFDKLQPHTPPAVN